MAIYFSNINSVSYFHTRMSVHLRLIFIFLTEVSLGFASNRPPKIFKQSEGRDIIYRPGESVVMSCEAHGVPNPRYIWKRNGEDFTSTGQDDRVVQLQNVGTIVINSAEGRDEGSFQCFADNGYGISASDKVNLRQAKLMPFPSEPKRLYRYDAGMPMTLPCNPPESYPPADVSWVLHQPDGRWQAVDFDKRVTIDIDGRLRFTNVKKSDEQGGRAYTCMAINNVLRQNVMGRENEIDVIGLTEEKHPVRELWTSPSDQLVLTGGTLRLQCIFSGNPTPDVYWEAIRGRTFPDRAEFKRFGQELRITNVQYEDSGLYQCAGLNTESEQRIYKAFDVSVESAPTWTVEPRDVVASSGDTATFICIAAGIPQLEYVWYINAVPLEDYQNETGVRDPRIYKNKRFFKPNANTITLTNLTLEDHMNIQCNASNKHGYVFADVYLNVIALTAPTSPEFLDVEDIHGCKRCIPAAYNVTVQITCFVEGGSQPIELNMFKDGKMITDVQRFEENKGFILKSFVQYNCTPTDDNVDTSFICTVKNPALKSEVIQTAKLYFKEIPYDQPSEESNNPSTLGLIVGGIVAAVVAIVAVTAFLILHKKSQDAATSQMGNRLTKSEERTPHVLPVGNEPEVDDNVAPEYQEVAENELVPSIARNSTTASEHNYSSAVEYEERADSQRVHQMAGNSSVMQPECDHYYNDSLVHGTGADNCYYNSNQEQVTVTYEQLDEAKRQRDLYTQLQTRTKK